MRKEFILSFLMLKSILICSQTLPAHYAHNPITCGVNNLFFNTGVCNKFQFIYTQAEIAAMTTPVAGPINISRIWFRHGGGASDPSTTMSNLIIKMGHTTLTAPTNQFSTNFNTGAPVTVLTSANYTYTPLIGAVGVPADNWTFIDLTTPFTYDFTNNICVEISFSNSSGYISGNFADNGGVPISQFAGVNTAINADGSTARPVFGISGGATPCPPVTATSSQINVTCNGGSDGSATVVASGGTTFTYTWSPSGGSNATASGLSAGNYTCIITNECGNSTTQTFTISETVSYQLNATVIQPTCGNNNGCIYFDPSPAGTYFYDWPFPTVMIVDSVCDLTPGSYDITINSINGCPIDTTIILANSNAATIDANPEISTINFGDSVQLNTTGGVSYIWNPSSSLTCFECPNPIAQPSQNTTYIVTGTDINGCSGSDTVVINVIPLPQPNFEFPNVITPNSDGTNDIFEIQNLPENTEVQILNRWGNIVFSSDNYQNNWEGKDNSGKELVEGVYTYIFKTEIGEIGHGFVTLIR
ncbi:MAG: T9SS type B sorting domain-containing protein [Bacteroidetes bacterium]|nr:T9SS type B sorting domain-containing protein [Bacteroidota bacterium]